MHSSVNKETNIDELREAYERVLREAEELRKKIAILEQNKPHIREELSEKSNRLERITHGITELTERMKTPYVLSGELEVIKDVLDVLAESGTCNSIILEGEPGTGKTQWAYAEVREELQQGKDVVLVHIRIKDTMRAQDLLYTVDNVQRLSDAQTKVQVPHALQVEARSWRDKILQNTSSPEDQEYIKFNTRMKALMELAEVGKDMDYMNYIDLGPLGEAIVQSQKGKKVYLLIDEIEKGREELMTGLLDELEHLSFTIAETGERIQGKKENLRIIITTNTEDSDKIPPAFRRRSLYQFITYPTSEEMEEIVRAHFPTIQSSLLHYALDTFYRYHDHSDITKKPSTPELLAWTHVLMKEYDGRLPEGIPHKEILLKYKDDFEIDIAARQLTERQDIMTNQKTPLYLERALQGKMVMHMRSELNNYHWQETFKNFYTNLANKKVTFQKPTFDVDEDDYRDTEYVLRDEFRVLHPGVESLGDGYYTIPKDLEALFLEGLDKQCTLLHEDELSEDIEFSSVLERTPTYIRGYLHYNGKEYEAFKKEKSPYIVLITPLHSMDNE